ncbi:MAG: hypothetical protein AAFX86_14530 [Pseudomonadota bacterium]
MTVPAEIRRQRGRTLLAIGAASAVMLGLMGLESLSGGSELERHPRAGTPVLLGLDPVADVARIDVRLADNSYALVRAGDGWRLDSDAGYPVRQDRIGELLTGLRSLSWGAAKTQDPRKLDQLGLADPDAGGNGAEILLRTTGGEIVADFIAGRRGDTLYLRNRGEQLSFSGEGELPPLNSRRAWLDFDVIAMVPDAIAGVVLETPEGERLHLVRQPDGGPRDFIPGPAHENERLVSRLAAATPALALSRFSPLDVKPDTALETAPVARHTTLTKDGLEVISEAYEEPDGLYLTIRAVEAAEGARRAQDVNARAIGWAFRLNRYDWADYTVSISDIVERAIVDPPSDG